MNGQISGARRFAHSFVALGGVSPADAIEAAAQASQRTLIASSAQIAQAADDAEASSDDAPDTSTDQNEPSVPEVPADPAGANLPDVIVTPDVTKPWKQLSLYGNYIEGLAEGPIAPDGTVNAGQVFPP